MDERKMQQSLEGNFSHKTHKKKGFRKDLTNSIFKGREGKGILQKFGRLGTQRETCIGVLRRFVRMDG